MPEATDWYFDVAAQVDLAEFGRGRVASVGDAGCCASPMSGQGSSLALIGAYVLAGELAAASGDHQAALAEYDRVMRPFVTTNQQLGVESAKFMTQDPEARHRSSSRAARSSPTSIAPHRASPRRPTPSR